MRPFQRMYDSNGYEVALFPLEEMSISQGENGQLSHQLTYNIDFLGYVNGIRVFNCPMYAPVTLKVVSLWDYNGSHTVTFESVSPVHLANGQIDYLTIGCTHDNNPPYHTIGDVIQQGNIFYHTGTYGGVTGDHVHMTIGQGHFGSYILRYQTPQYYCYDLSNRIHMYDGLYVNDTTILDGEGYDWKTFQGGSPEPPTPTPTYKHKFPWVLYAENLRKS